MIYFKDMVKCIPVFISFYFLSVHINKSNSKNSQMFPTIMCIFVFIILISIITCNKK